MDGMRTWLLSLIFAAVLCAVARALMPEGAVKRVGGLVCGLVLLSAALAPADVLDVWLADEGKGCRVIVPDDQLSLAIGKEGQNARLAARLTGYKIDIKPASYKDEA